MTDTAPNTTTCDNPDAEHPGFPCAHPPIVEEAPEFRVVGWGPEYADPPAAHRYESELDGAPIHYQTRARGGQWRYVHGRIGDALQRAGMRHSEVAAHIADLDAGHVLTAEDWTEFRVAR